MDANPNSGIRRNIDIKAIRNKSVNEKDTYVRGQRKCRRKSSPSSYQSTYKRILRSGTAFGCPNESKRMKYADIPSRRQTEKNSQVNKTHQPCSTKKNLLDKEKNNIITKSASGHQWCQAQTKPSEKRHRECNIGNSNNHGVNHIGSHETDYCIKNSKRNQPTSDDIKEMPKTERVIQETKQETSIMSDVTTVSLLDQQQNGFANQTFVVNQKLDFINPQEISEEVFLVSLSKDENKEINMLTTSTCTRHLGTSGINKKQFTGLNCPNKCRNVIPTDEQLFTVPHSNAVSPGIRTDSSNTSMPFNLDASFDEIDKMDMNHSKIKIKKISTKTANKNVNFTNSVSNYLESRGNVENNVSDLTTTGIEICDKISSISPRKIPKTGYHSIKCSETDKTVNNLPLSEYIEERGTSEIRNRVAEVKLKRLTQLPLIKNILNTDDILTNYADHIKISTVTTNTTQTIAADCNNEAFSLQQSYYCDTANDSFAKDFHVKSKYLVKRSERIRSKSLSTGHQSNVSSIINCSTKTKDTSNQKDSLQESNLTQKEKCASALNGDNRQTLQEMSTQSRAPVKDTTGKSISAKQENQVSEKTSENKKNMKKKKKCSIELQPKVEKKAKDFSRGKACMSQEVMDGIVKSIEETVSRVRRENEEEERDMLCKTESTYNTNLAVENAIATNTRKSVQSVKIIDEKIKVPPNLELNHPDKVYMDEKNESQILTANKCSNACRHPKVKMECNTTKCHKAKVNGTGVNNDTVDKGKRGKRFRKKTRKAEEAMGDQEMFWEDDKCWPVRKTKPRRR